MQSLWHLRKKGETVITFVQCGGHCSGQVILCKEKNNIVAEYALKDIEKPMGVASYKFGDAIPKDFRSSLPSIDELETTLNKSINMNTTDEKKEPVGISEQLEIEENNGK